MEFKCKLKQIPCVKIKIPSFYLIFLLHKKHVSSSFLLRQAHLKMQVILGWTLMWTCLFELIKLSLNTKVKLFFQLYRHSNFYCYFTLSLTIYKKEWTYLQLRYPNFLKCDSLSHLVHVHDTHNVCNDLKEIFISLVILLSSLFVLSLFVLRCLSISVL